MQIYIYTKENGEWIKNDSHSVEWDEDKKYEYHYVAFAIPGLTCSAAYFLRCKEIVGDSYKRLFFNINHKNEAGTLFPNHKATFLPVHKANYYLGTIKHRDGVTDAEFREYFRDVEKANSLIGTDTIVFDLRDYNNMLLLQTHLESIALDVLKANISIKTMIVLR